MVFVESAGEKNTFTGLSGVFLTQNGVCATFFLFMNIKAKKFTMKAIFDSLMNIKSPDQAPKDPNRDLKTEILEQHKDEKWFPNYSEII